MSTPKFHVGQTVIVNDVNRRRGREPRRAEVVKVGRSLVHIQSEWGGRSEAYRIDTGVRNDSYGHQSLSTEEEYAESQERAALMERIHARGVRFDYVAPKYANDALAQLADILEAADHPTPTPSHATDTQAKEDT